MQGIELAACMVPDVVLLDIGLPGIDGYEVVRRLKADPATRHILDLVLVLHEVVPAGPVDPDGVARQAQARKAAVPGLRFPVDSALQHGVASKLSPV